MAEHPKAPRVGGTSGSRYTRSSGSTCTSCRIAPCAPRYTTSICTPKTSARSKASSRGWLPSCSRRSRKTSSAPTTGSREPAGASSAGSSSARRWRRSTCRRTDGTSQSPRIRTASSRAEPRDPVVALHARSRVLRRHAHHAYLPHRRVRWAPLEHDDRRAAGDGSAHGLGTGDGATRCARAALGTRTSRVGTTSRCRRTHW